MRSSILGVGGVAIVVAVAGLGCEIGFDGTVKTGSSRYTELSADQLFSVTMEVFSEARQQEPFDVKVKELEAKLGPPMKTEGALKYWWGSAKEMIGRSCRELRIDTAEKSMKLGPAPDPARCRR